jgi:hypothetical protein
LVKDVRAERFAPAHQLLDLVASQHAAPCQAHCQIAQGASVQPQEPSHFVPQCDLVVVRPEQVRDLLVIATGADRFAVEDHFLARASGHEHADPVEAARGSRREVVTRIIIADLYAQQFKTEHGGHHCMAGLVDRDQVVIGHGG